MACRHLQGISELIFIALNSIRVCFILTLPIYKQLILLSCYLGFGFTLWTLSVNPATLTTTSTVSRLESARVLTLSLITTFLLWSTHRNLLKTLRSQPANFLLDVILIWKFEEVKGMITAHKLLIV